MLQIPSELLARFNALLNKKQIAEPYRPHYQKWLRYYLDFCAKYRHSASKPESLLFFKDKLREKHQTDMQVNQASHAVSLYYELAGISEFHQNPVGSQMVKTDAHAPYTAKVCDREEMWKRIFAQEDAVRNAGQSCTTHSEHKAPQHITSLESTPVATLLKDKESRFDVLLIEKGIPTEYPAYYSKWLHTILIFVRNTVIRRPGEKVFLFLRTNSRKSVNRIC